MAPMSAFAARKATANPSADKTNRLNGASRPSDETALIDGQGRDVAPSLKRRRLDYDNEHSSQSGVTQSPQDLSIPPNGFKTRESRLKRHAKTSLTRATGQTNNDGSGLLQEEESEAQRESVEGSVESQHETDSEVDRLVLLKNSAIGLDDGFPQRCLRHGIRQCASVTRAQPAAFNVQTG